MSDDSGYLHDCMISTQAENGKMRDRIKELEILRDKVAFAVNNMVMSDQTYDYFLEALQEPKA